MIGRAASKEVSHRTVVTLTHGTIPQLSQLCLFVCLFVCLLFVIAVDDDDLLLLFSKGQHHLVGRSSYIA